MKVQFVGLVKLSHRREPFRRHRRVKHHEVNGLERIHYFNEFPILRYDLKISYLLQGRETLLSHVHEAVHSSALRSW